MDPEQGHKHQAQHHKVEEAPLLGFTIDDLISKNVPRCCVQYHDYLIFLYIFLIGFVMTIILIFILVVDRNN
jgi:uncharacterized membrane protein